MFEGDDKSPDVTSIDVWLACETCKLALFNVVLPAVTVKKLTWSLHLTRIGSFAQSRFWSCLQKLQKRIRRTILGLCMSLARWVCSSIRIVFHAKRLRWITFPFVSQPCSVCALALAGLFCSPLGTFFPLSPLFCFFFTCLVSLIACQKPWPDDFAALFPFCFICIPVPLPP